MRKRTEYNVACDLLPPETSIFQLEGFYALLIGQKVPHRRARSVDSHRAADPRRSARRQRRGSARRVGRNR
jgi:hypothetical protein